MLKNWRELENFLNKITKLDSDYFLSEAVNQVYLCVEDDMPKFTEFLDPFRLQYTFDVLAGIQKFGVNLHGYGGFPYAERKMLGFFPNEIDEEKFPISRIKLDFASKFGELTHRDILGAVLGLGLNRNVVGDISVLIDGAVVAVDSKVKDYLNNNLLKVGRASVETSILPLDSEFFALDNRVKERIICVSLRLDAVLAATFRLTRGEISGLIKSGKAFVNWVKADSSSKTVQSGDMITLRKFGRLQIDDIVGKSKKERYLIDIIRF